MAGDLNRAAALALAAIFGAQAAVPDGKGLGNLEYAPAQVGKKLSLIVNREGHGWVAMHRGYLVVIYSKDSGLGQGAISFLDVSDPRAPKQVHERDDSVTHEIREPHGWGMRGDVACLQANYGMHFWDFSDVTAPKLLSYARLPDIAVSDYDKGMWWTHWQGGYAYGGGSGNGLYIVDAKDPAKPRFVKKVPVSQLGGFRVGPVFAIGNLLVISGTDVGGISTLDIGDPENPRLLASVSGAVSYSSKVNGGTLVLAGSGDNDGYALFYDVSDPTRIRSLGKSSPSQGDKGGYVGFADGYAYVGFSSKGFAKIDMSKPTYPVVQAGTSDLPGHDEDFAVPLANLVFVGNDHPGQGSSLIPHQAGKDTVGPEVNMVSPADKAIDQPLTSRIGFTLTDDVKAETLTPENVAIRPVGGQALEGWYATQSAIVNFTPKQALQPVTDYELIVKAGGVSDYAGNPSTRTFRSVFRTKGNVGVTRGKPGIATRAAGSRAPSLIPFRRAGSAGPSVEARGRALPESPSPLPGAKAP